MADTEMQGGAQAAFDGAVDEVLRRQAAVRKHQLQQFLGAWLEQQHRLIAETLALMPPPAGPEREHNSFVATNLIGALQVAAAVRPPAEEPDRPRDELVQEANVDARSPIQYLVLDVLAARHRLGERVWTFPLRLKTALKVLAAEGLIGWKPGFNQGTALVWLTDAGRTAVLSESYEPPSAPLATHYPGDGQGERLDGVEWGYRFRAGDEPIPVSTRDFADEEVEQLGGAYPSAAVMRRPVGPWVPADAPTPESNHATTDQDTQP